MNAPASMTGRQVYRRLLSMVLKHRLIFGLALLAVGLDAAGQGLFFYLLRPLIDDTIANPNPEFNYVLPALVFLSLVLRVVGNFGGEFGMQWVGRKLIADLRNALFDRYLELPAAYFDRESSGQMISRLTYNTEQVAEAATKALIGVSRDVMTVIALFGVMLIQSWRLTVSLLLLLPIIAVIAYIISRHFRRISTNIQDSMGDVTHITEEAVNGHQVVKVFGGQQHERDKFQGINESNRKLHLRLVGTQLLSSSLVQMAAGVALVVLLVVAASDLMGDTVTAGIFMSVLAALAATIPPLKRLTKMHVTIERGVAAAESIFRVVDTPGETDDGSYEPEHVRGDIRFENVSFSYPDASDSALIDLDLHIPAGKVTALVGRSGSGKSTIVKLLPRFYQPAAGRILIDDVDIRDFKLSALRDHISLVSQDVVLFNDTIGRNIAYGGLASATPRQIEDAARAAHAMEFIERLPRGLDTPIGEDGSLLSGGQRQRIAIARAVLKDAPILILDEATSALDAESEQAVQDALEELMENRTTLVIAHRLATVQMADQVVVLDHGREVESGSHAELLERDDGLYRYLHRLQLAGA
ncbi:MULTISPECIES: lipid A export permease/ATP-binding protein MsbA [unclassified Wenzhouxiangella]|uniref:lipid A export permease/ATP-binding protein MsbA n=1 Tax=unclassified Wenzhouxiangella TaxID=2613841 RepID=UPI000E329D6C|nr:MULTISPECIES: lipid A export permease/ATP-binding protein MsbA [unclassified Wenzhouxiangella]RFF28235.1 lipid A export permease/ATP-binding protein MsbA [Wenzhouxiangella sp. 15181]RFP67910.1 lipid A export permease/ATP-binding protein MsbA [Wenzhouxiangella sp. 15190]